MDNHRIEIAYGVLVIIEWLWAFSQLKDAVQASEGKWWPPSWKFTTALRIFGKAAFFTYVGTVWWLDYFNPLHHEIAIYVLVAIQVWVFVQWLRLPSPAVVERDALDLRHAARSEQLEHTAEIQAETGVILAKRGKRLSDAGIELDKRVVQMSEERQDLDDRRQDMNEREGEERNV